ncbi:hypothetical protein QF001_001733 [Paraburkholderia youngii]
MQRLERNCRFSFGKTLLCRESAAEAWQCGATLNVAAGSGRKVMEAWLARATDAVRAVCFAALPADERLRWAIDGVRDRAIVVMRGGLAGNARAQWLPAADEFPADLHAHEARIGEK